MPLNAAPPVAARSAPPAPAAAPAALTAPAEAPAARNAPAAGPSPAEAQQAAQLAGGSLTAALFVGAGLAIAWFPMIAGALCIAGAICGLDFLADMAGMSLVKKFTGKSIGGWVSSAFTPRPSQPEAGGLSLRRQGAVTPAPRQPPNPDDAQRPDPTLLPDAVPTS